MILTEVLGLKKGFRDHKLAPRPQKWPEMAAELPKAPQKITFSLAGDLAAITWAIGQSVFIK